MHIRQQDLSDSRHGVRDLMVENFYPDTTNSIRLERYISALNFEVSN